MNYLFANPLFWRYSWILSSSSTGNWEVLFYTETREAMHWEQFQEWNTHTYYGKQKSKRDTQLQQALIVVIFIIRD